MSVFGPAKSRIVRTRFVHLAGSLPYTTSLAKTRSGCVFNPRVFSGFSLPQTSFSTRASFAAFASTFSRSSVKTSSSPAWNEKELVSSMCDTRDECARATIR